MHATYDEKTGSLVASPNQKQKARDRDILALFGKRVLTRVTNDQGEVLTFEEAGLSQETYLQEHAKYGYANLPYKLAYIIKPNLPTTQQPYGYVLPINGYGLWDAIYGYLGLKADADTVLGMTWYDQKETPGLGGNIALPKWQEQFQGKKIFQESVSGETNYARAQLGIQVVKTTVQETYGNSFIGVNEALRKSLEPYRPFLIRAHGRESQQ